MLRGFIGFGQLQRFRSDMKAARSPALRRHLNILREAEAALEIPRAIPWWMYWRDLSIALSFRREL